MQHSLFGNTRGAGGSSRMCAFRFPGGIVRLQAGVARLGQRLGVPDVCDRVPAVSLHIFGATRR
eukprot:8764632-Pyramimonas_sp.AAC.2